MNETKRIKHNQILINLLLHYIKFFMKNIFILLQIPIECSSFNLYKLKKNINIYKKLKVRFEKIIELILNR